jgi:hypothetical protein
MNSKANSGLLILIMIMSIFIGVVTGFLVSNGICNKKIADLEDELQLYYDEDDKEEAEEYHRRRGEYGRTEKNETENTTIDLDANEKNAVVIEGNTCTIDISKAKTGDVFNATVRPEFVVSFEITSKASNSRTEWNISINDKKAIYRDEYFNELDEIKFHFTDKYILYSTYEGTDIRSEQLIVFDTEGNKVREIYDMDENNKGLVYYEASYTNTALIIKASRGSHGGSIVAPKYGTISPSDGFTTAADVEKFPADLVIDAVYVYKINADGSIDFDNPQVIVTETYKEFMQAKVNNSTEESELIVAIRNWLEKNK